MGLNKAVFLDRDGVITCDPPHYAHRLDQLQLIPGSAEAIRVLNEHQFRVIVISNQSGVGRGYYTEADVKIFNDGMESLLLAEAGARIDALSYCPHHPEAIVASYRMDCECRKPKPGMIFGAAQKYDLNLVNSFVVGDKWSDIEAGRAAGSRTVLVLTGHGREEYDTRNGSADYIAENLRDAVLQFILPTDNYSGKTE